MTQPSDAVTYPAAELDRRFYAFAIDRLIAWSIFGGAGYEAWHYLIDDDRLALGIAAIAGSVVVLSLGYAVLLGIAGISPGKALVGLRLVGYGDGRPIGFVPAVVRTTLVGAATLPTLGLGLATLAWTAVMDPSGRRRGVHDRCSRSIVVDVRPVPEPVREVEEQPRQIVNLTAMRLMPTPPPPALRAPVRAVKVPAPPAPALDAPPTSRSTQPQPQPPAPAATPPADPPSASVLDRPIQSPPPSPPPPPSSSVLEGPTVRRALGPPLVDAPEPKQASAWRVTFDTGESFVVEGLALVGRRPEPRDGEPVSHVVALRSSDMSLSKTHAQFQVVPDGALVVMDRGSTNGSVVFRKGVSKALTAERPSTLLEGDIVRFGDRTMAVTRDAT